MRLVLTAMDKAELIKPGIGYALSGSFIRKL